ncbi:MAG TPA: SLC13 family permease [Bacteroidales bacterium]|nr:SLC13 family permease [Bacteroidales bacterium]
MYSIITNTQVIAIVIFIITYIGIIFTRLPWINIDRPSAAFFGAVAMLIFNVMTFQEAINAIDYNTISLLLGMMIIIATLQIDGFFAFIANKTIVFAKNQIRLLIIIVLITGTASAFLVNDTVVLLFTPIIITICNFSGINPIPYLIAEILASNIGSTMAITGNPQNMLIGINSGLSYSRFFAHLLPIALIGLISVILFVKWFFANNFKNNKPINIITETAFQYKLSSMRISVTIFLLIVIMFFFSKELKFSIPVISLLGASLMMICSQVKPSEIIKKVDWVLLLFFSSLFIVVKGIENTSTMQYILNANPLNNNIQGVVFLHGLSLVMSQIISNVPYTVVMLPIMKAVNSNLLWISLASSATLAGNATIIGAMANLIVVESANKYGVKINFIQFLKVGLPCTLFTLLASIGIFYIQLYFNLIN